MRVMIVEDQTMIRSLLESYFRAEDGHQIVASISGAKQAVEVCRTTQVDLILMDVQTEHRENGLTAVRQIKAMHPEIVIVVVTSLIDGAVPKEKITEGGGLSMLRQRIEEAGGKMEVWSIPRFKLMLSLPEQEEAAHESDDR